MFQSPFFISNNVDLCDDFFFFGHLASDQIASFLQFIESLQFNTTSKHVWFCGFSSPSASLSVPFRIWWTYPSNFPYPASHLCRLGRESECSHYHRLYSKLSQSKPTCIIVCLFRSAFQEKCKYACEHPLIHFNTSSSQNAFKNNNVRNRIH